MALMPVADALAAVLSGADALPAEMMRAGFGLPADPDARPCRAPHPAAAGDVGHGRLCGARSRCCRRRSPVEGHRRGRRRAAVRSRRRARRGRAHLHRRRHSRRRRCRDHPGRHHRRRRFNCHYRSSGRRTPYPPGRRRFLRRRRVADRRQPPHRPPSLARRRDELSKPARASAAQGGTARHWR